MKQIEISADLRWIETFILLEYKLSNLFQLKANLFVDS